MKIVLLFILTAVCAARGTERMVDLMFGEYRYSGRLHRNLVLIEDKGCKAIARTRDATAEERNTLAVKFQEDTRSTTRDGMLVIEAYDLGRMFLFRREVQTLDGEECSRGEMRVLRKGEWYHGVWSIRTVGWESLHTDRNSAVWGGFRFMEKRNGGK